MNDQQATDTAMMDQAALLSFVQKLLEEKKDPSLTGEKQKAVEAMLLSQVNDAMNLHLVNRLSLTDQAALDELLDKNPSDDDVYAFFQQKIPNLDVEIASSLVTFRNAFLMPSITDLGTSDTPQEQTT